MKLVKISETDRLDLFNVIVVRVQRSAYWYQYGSIEQFIDDNIGDDDWGDIGMFKFLRDASGAISVDSNFGLMTLDQAFEDEVLDADDARLVKGLDAAFKSSNVSHAVKFMGWDGIDWVFFANADDASGYFQREQYQAATSDFNADYVLEDVGDVISLFGERWTLPPHLSGVDSECARIIADHYEISGKIAYYLLERANRTTEKNSSQTS